MTRVKLFIVLLAGVLVISGCESMGPKTTTGAVAGGLIEYRLWREAVFARDNFICQKCSKRGGNLEAHHIKSFKNFPELRFAIDNGLTLCVLCHNQTKKKLR